MSNWPKTRIPRPWLSREGAESRLLRPQISIMMQATTRESRWEWRACWVSTEGWMMTNESWTKMTMAETTTCYQFLWRVWRVLNLTTIPGIEWSDWSDKRPMRGFSNKKLQFKWMTRGWLRGVFSSVELRRRLGCILLCRAETKIGVILLCRAKTKIRAAVVIVLSSVELRIHWNIPFNWMMVTLYRNRGERRRFGWFQAIFGNPSWALYGNGWSYIPHLQGLSQ